MEKKKFSLKIETFFYSSYVLSIGETQLSWRIAAFLE